MTPVPHPSPEATAGCVGGGPAGDLPGGREAGHSHQHIVMTAPKRPGNSLFPQHIRESLTTFSPIMNVKRPPAGVHVVRNFSGQRICAHLDLFTDLGERGEMTTGDS